MFPAGSIEDARKAYENDGSSTLSGIWSVLLTQHEADAAAFANRYFDHFNKLTQHYWHLKVFAEGSVSSGKWKPKKELHEASQKLREGLNGASGTRKTLPPMCIAFFDPKILKPNGSTENGGPIAILPLDEKALSKPQVFAKGIDYTQVAIEEAFRELGYDHFAELSDKQALQVIERVRRKLNMHVVHEKAKCYIIKPTIFITQCLVASILNIDNFISGS